LDAAPAACPAAAWGSAAENPKKIRTADARFGAASSRENSGVSVWKNMFL